MMASLSLLLELAWRNLWRNKRRTTVILFALVLGVWAMIVMSAFMRGISLQIVEDTVNNLTGHIQIHHHNYLDDPVIDNSFTTDEGKLQSLLSSLQVEKWSPRIRLPAVVSSERDSIGLTLVAIEPQKESSISFIGTAVTEGRMLRDATDPGVIIGRKLAERLETGLGRRVVIMSENAQDQISDRGFRIVGIFDAPLEATETGVIFAGRAVVSKLLDMGDSISEIAIRLDDIENADGVSQHLSRELSGLDVQPWHGVAPLARLTVEIYDSFHIIWHLIVFLAMGFGIINTLLMAVFERTREFGLFQALGLRPRFIMSQVWLEAVLLLAVGLAAGNIFSWLTIIATGEGIDVAAFAQGLEMANLSNVIPFIIVAEDLILANMVVIVLGLVTSLYPAWRASRLVPADAITRI